MTPLEIAAILAAGMAAGTINAIVGSGSLITFPTLLAFGYSPLVANVSNTIGLVPGSISGAVGYRSELVAVRGRAVPLVVASLLGAVTGAVLLLVLPASAFERVVPILILGAVLLVAFQPRISRWLTARHGEGAEHAATLFVTVFASGIYGGYFGAGQGVILFALLAIFLTDDLRQVTGLKNVLQALVNAVSGIIFIFVATVAWEPALLIAIGSVIGGQVGARVGRRLPAVALRAFIVVLGTAVALRLFIG